jgi:hypothetical protein
MAVDAAMVRSTGPRGRRRTGAIPAAMKNKKARILAESGPLERGVRRVWLHDPRSRTGALILMAGAAKLPRSAHANGACKRSTARWAGHVSCDGASRFHDGSLG